MFAELRKRAAEGEYDVFGIHRINYLLGHLATGRGWPDVVIERFFRKGSVRFLDHPHLWLECLGRRTDLPATPELSIEHHSWRTVRAFISRMNVYTESEAQHMLSLGWKPSFKRMFLRPARIFFQYYLKHGGYRNGRTGVVLASLMATYWFVSALKLWELCERDQTEGTP